MYKPGTILTLKNPRDPDPETGEEFPYNEVIVVGASPVTHAEQTKYTGADAHGVIVSPRSSFGAVLDEPFGKLTYYYDVESIPEPEEIVREIRVPVIQPEDLGPTPEQVFAKEAPAAPGAPRRPSHASPLAEPENDPKQGDYSPLGQEGEGSAPAPKAASTSPLDEDDD